MLTIPKAKYDTHYIHGPEKAVPVLKKVRKALRKGEKNRRVIKVVVIGDYEFSYHATRGWRRSRL